jgi:uncharacterized RDD family membrane protein YckC
MQHATDRAAPLDTEVALETPEHIVLYYRLAGPVRRLLAYLLDLVICYGALALLGAAIALAYWGAALVQAETFMQNFIASAMGVVLLALFAAQWLYFAVLEGWRGRTPGKTALDLRVVTTEGRPIGFRASALRNVLRAADAMPLEYTVGLLSMAGLTSMTMTRRFQRLGDLVAGTLVVVSQRPRAMAPLVLSPVATQAEMVPLRGGFTLDSDERRAVEMFLRRRRGLGEARANELARMIAPLLAARAGLTLPDPARTLAVLYERVQSSNRGPWPSTRPPR